MKAGSIKVITTWLFLWLAMSSVFAQTKTFIKIDTVVNDEWGSKIIREHDNGYLIAGSSRYLSNRSLVLRKIDSSGNLVWNKTFSMKRKLARIYCNTPVFEGQFLIAGEMDHLGDTTASYASELFFAKLNVNGDTVWTKKVPWEKGANKVISIINTSDGYVFTGAKHFVDLSGRSIGYISKMDFSGKVQWTLEVGERAVITSVLQGENGHYLATGYMQDDGHMPILLSINDNGKLVRQTSLNFSTLFATPISLLPAGGDSCYVIGYFTNLGYNDGFVALVRDTTILWHKTYGGNKHDPFLYASIWGKSIYIQGTTNTDPIGDFSYADFWLLKLDENGDTLWTRQYGTGKAERSFHILASNNGAIAVGSIDDRKHLAVLKIEGNGFIDNEKNDLLTSVSDDLVSSIFEVYPNPFQENIQLKIKEPNTRIEVYDLIGERVHTQMLFKGSNYIKLGHLTCGTYMLKTFSIKGSRSQVLIKQ